jgi:crotonobetainyl-CoA:carnitine CoA-transferase CaiB-like acyl-CoA transferase
MTRPLDGVRILDFTHVLAGPFATRVLGDMGADVVKVSSVERALAANEPSHPYYLMWNRNKRALALDMANEESRPICRQLCEKADIVIDNFSVGVLDRWNVGYAAVSEVNPGVIYLQMSGMGDGGPWSDFVTYAPTIHALAGLTHMTGVPGRENIGIGFSYNDHQAGLHGAVAILAALEARRRTGRGQRIDMSQFELGVNFAGPALLDYFANGKAARPVGNKLPYDDAAPHGCYPCAGALSDAVEDERWVAIACMTDAHWGSLREVMGDPEWSRDDVFITAAGRLENVERLDQGIAEWTRNRDAVEVMELCQHAGVPAGVVQNVKDFAERDPQLMRSGFMHMIDSSHPTVGTTYADKLPLRFQATPCDIYERPREIGEDNLVVLQDWIDMSEDEIQKAKESGILS